MDYLQSTVRVNLLRNQCKIFDAISKHTNLRKQGDFYVGSCPFHESKTESLAVNPNEGRYYCFECHAGGDVFNFLARINGQSLSEAIESCAKNFKIDLYQTRNNFDDERIESRNRALFEVNDYARDFYHDLLMDTDTGDVCRKYLESRGISKRELEKFHLGFAPNAEGKLAAYLDEYGFKFEVVLQTGLVDATSEGFDDKLQDCITLPIVNRSGQTMALVGQVFNFDKKVFYETEGITGQYILPRESPIFNSQRLVFGLIEASGAVVASKCVIVVENCLDVVSLVGAGVENVVSTFDKTLTVGQAENLTDLAEKIIFCLKSGEVLQVDEDTLKIIANHDAKILVAALPTNPYEYLVEKGVEAFQKSIADAVPFDEYKFHKRLYAGIVQRTPNSLSVEMLRRSPIVHKLSNAILKVICRDAGALRYALSLLPVEVLTERHRDTLEYLKICLEENSRPCKEGAEIFFEGNVDAEFLQMIEDNAPLREKDREVFEDALEYMVKMVHKRNINHLRGNLIEEEENISQEKLSEYSQLMQNDIDW